MWPEFETAVRSSLVGRVPDPDLVWGIIDAFAHKYLGAASGEVTIRQRPILIPERTAHPIARPRIRRAQLGVTRLDPLDLQPGRLEQTAAAALRVSSAPPLQTPWENITAPPGWDDYDLMALTRDTAPYTPGGDWYDVRPHLLPLYALAKWVCWPNPKEIAPDRPPLCVEIGVREGPSTLALLSAMRETGGTLVSVDSDPVSSELASATVFRHGLNPWWQLRVTDSDTFAELFREPIDLLWLDGDHSYEQVTADLAHFLPLVRQDGFVALHDYYTEADPADETKCSGVAQAVAELRARGGYEVLTLPWSHGLTLVRVL